MSTAIPDRGVRSHRLPNLCPICGGHEGLPQGEGKRCFGFTTDDGWVHCTREQFAGRATYYPKSQTYAHRLDGNCPCGVSHTPGVIYNGNGSGNGHSNGHSHPPRRPRPQPLVAEIEAVYPYFDESGALLYEAIRYRPKGFSQRRPDPDHDGGYISNLKGVRRVPYRLPEVLAATPGQRILIAEGEKDVETLVSNGFVATTNAGGAGKWPDEFSKYFAGRVVAIVPDHDAPGLDHAQSVAASLARAGAAEVKVVKLPRLDGSKGCKDVTDWFGDHGGTLAELLRLLESTPAWRPTSDVPSAQPGLGKLSDSDLGLVGAHLVKPRPVRWLWQHRVSHGKLTMIAGDGGKGKTLLGLWMAAQVTTGGAWPDGSGNAELGDAVILSAEDAPEDTLAPRLIAMGADLKRVRFLTAKVTIRRDGENKPPMVHPKSLQDLEYWSEVFRRVPDCRLFFVDSLPGYLGRGVNDAKNSEVRAIVEPFLSEIIQPRAISMVSVTHLNKAVDAQAPAHRILGSVAYVNLPRNVHIVASDPDDSKRRFFKQVKCNIAPDDLPALAFRIEPREVEVDGGESIGCIVPVFEEAPVDIDIHSAMGKAGKHRGPGPTARRDLARWLVDYLKPHAGGVRVKAVFDAAGEAGLIGTLKEDAKGREMWTSGTKLYRAKDHVTELEGDYAGYSIQEDRDDSGRYPLKYWRIVAADDADTPVTF